VAVYTPMKRKSPWCVTVGAISGAIPPVIGWAAATGSLGAGAWILFGILFFWQMPHFLSLAWMYRDEYAQAGFFMLRRRDIAGIKAATESLVCAVALTVVTVLPVFPLTSQPGIRAASFPRIDPLFAAGDGVDDGVPALMRSRRPTVSPCP
jgi:protoheme IX farnesyltransferase